MPISKPREAPVIEPYPDLSRAVLGERDRRVIVVREAIGSSKPVNRTGASLPAIQRHRVEGHNPDVATGVFKQTKDIVST
jgi:hypothetical protein